MVSAARAARAAATALIALTVTAGTARTAAAQPPAPSPSTTATTTTVQPAPGAAPLSPAEQTWLVAVHQAHVATIAGGWDARRHATQVEVRDLGRELVTDHTALDSTVTDLATKYGTELPFGMNDAQRDALYGLQSRDGEAYDAAWLRLQIAQHRQIVAGGDELAASSTTPDVAAAARETAEVCRTHLDELVRVSRGLGIGTPTTVSGGTGGQLAADTARAAATRSGAAALLAVAGIGLIGAELRRWRRRAAR